MPCAGSGWSAEFPGKEAVVNKNKKLAMFFETYKDVKVAVQNDYQKFLEEKWVKSLRKKYKVKICLLKLLELLQF